MANDNKKLLIIEANGYKFHVDPETDIIEECYKSFDNSKVVDSIGNEFSMYMGETALQYQKSHEKKDRKRVVMKNNNSHQPNDKKKFEPRDRKPYQNNKPNNNGGENKSFQKRKPRGKVKVLIPNQPIFEPNHCLSILADLMYQEPKPEGNPYCIIATYKDCIDLKMFDDLNLKYYAIEPEDHIAWMKVRGENNKLITKRNPLFPWSMGWIMYLFSKHIDILIVPANKYILKEIKKTKYKVNLLIPSKEAKTEYLNLISEEKNNFRKNFEKNFERFIEEMEEYKDKEKYANFNFVTLDKENIKIFKENIQNLKLEYNQ